ncbi:phosphate/phosphite/phosphonate ABC transporter substrate-binding protein [Rhizobium sp. 007]|uniref:phosphate/phosphite/phosphonate ABC transporter substrate-binding protein n=1 Tax=Rhizobium sp. 007 TaxID=2785056 RepID=UPI00188EC6EF|nr:phosphate/phosphite/phosphonate ABC transporter substrate-binding protein [Rhizobium sp. 007]QPB24513.1 phosphate/phosphite/phosphonate ABC transporter substrate-binding protein [Rhizobium sp. 007]
MLKDFRVSRREAMRLTALGVAATALPLSALAQSKGQDTLRVAVAPYLPTQSDTEKAYRPLNQFLADSVGMKLDMKVASDWAGVSTAISSGQADVALMGPWGYALCHANSGAEIFATETSDGAPTYKAIIVGRKGLDFSSFPKDAKGLSIAFGDSGGFSAWMYPQYWFNKQGIDPRSYFKYTEGVAPAAIMTSVASGQIDLGCIWDSLRWQMIHNGTITEDSHQVVYASEPLPNGGYVHRADLDKGIVSKLQDALASIDAKKARQLNIPEPNTGFVRDSHASYTVVDEMGKTLGLL